MRLIRWLSLLLIVFALAGSFVSASAQSYYFAVERAEVHLYINADGSATVDYVYVFANQPKGATIEYVDIGMPTTQFSTANASADINGKKITDISISTYIDNGIAFGLGANSIPPGKKGTFHARITGIQGMLFYTKPVNNEDYASFNFQPNYFDSSLVTGNTDYPLTLHLPPGIEPEEPRYFTPAGWPGAAEPESGYDQQGSVFYRWRSTEANTANKYRFGASFPARLMPEGVLKRPTLWDTLGIDDDTAMSVGCCAGFLGLITWVSVSSAQAAKKRRLQYMPPRISVEGHGIKRGLTAIEAAILMEQPLDKVLTMTLFSILKKGAATVTSLKPLTLERADPLPETLQPYEIEFLDAFKEKDGPARQKALQSMVVALVKSVGEKMKGFSRKETLEYYRSIMTKAWEQVEAANTPEVKSQRYDELLGWTMLDRDYDRRTREVFSSGPVYVPGWWGRLDPTFARPIGGSAPAAFQGSGAAGVSAAPGSLPHLPGSDFAARVVNSVQNVSSGIVNDVNSFTSGITNRTNPIPQPSSSSSSSRGRSGGGGGRSCACACACAGCACACAGGGR